MKKIITILSLFQLLNSFGQSDNLKKEIFKDLLNNTYNYSTPKIVNKLDSVAVEYHLKRLIGKHNRTFFTEMDKSNDSVHGIKLTEIEKEFLICSIRKQYKSEWTKKDFAEYKIIKSNESIKYLKSNDKNTLVEISDPIFLRDNEIAFIYFSNLCCSKYGRADLSFYKKENGKWQRWISVSSVDF